MSDDLAAFFAKKAQKKSKKKNVVSLDDVGQQLERRVRIQESGEPDYDENEKKETKENSSSKVQQNSEDSEWIECSEKPSIVGLTFKEFTENPDETLEEQNKRANSETNKTWNIVSKTADSPATVDTLAAKPVVKSTYQAPSQRRPAPLDLTNQEMFPSIADADEIAEKLKTEEKKKAAASVKAEEQFQEKKSVWRPRTPGDAGINNSGARFETQRGGGGGPPSGGGGYRSLGGGHDSSYRSGGERGGGYESNYRSSDRFGGGGERSASGGRRTDISNDSGADDVGGGGSWRDGPRASATPSSQGHQAYSHSSASGGGETGGGGGSWRDGPRASAAASTPSSQNHQAYSQSSVSSGGMPPQRSTAEESNNWRSTKKVAAATPSPAAAPTPSPAVQKSGGAKKYVPPSQRQQAST